MSSSLSLKDGQVASIKRILNLNHPLRESGKHNDVTGGAPPTQILNEEGEPIWKVLVFDNLGRDVISSVLRVNDLRELGITIHLNITQQRHAIPDAPVVYLVEPTEENVKRITTDLQNGLYSPAYINFLSSISRPLLEDFATQTAQAGTVENISQVFDQYLNFIVSEPNLFSLGMGNDTYWKMNSPRTSDQDIDANVDRIVSGLFSTAVTMGTIPIIRAPKGGAAEIIAAKLDRKLRDHILNAKDNLFSGSRSASGEIAMSSRPVLIIVDRNVDLVPMLSHSWTYQSLIHDVLDMRLNRITVETPVDEENPSKGTTRRTYDLTSNDFFWNRNASAPFPQVAEEIDKELKRYTDESMEITKNTGAKSIEDLQNDTSAAAQHLKTAMTKLPELRERKALLDMHMNILTALLKALKERQIDNYFQLEEDIKKQTKTQMLELINDPDKGNNPHDKLRLFIIWFLSTEQEVTRGEIDRFSEALSKIGCDVSPLTYIRQVREVTRMTMISSAPAQPATQQTSTSSNIYRGLTSFSSLVTDRFKDAGFENIISSVKNILPANKDLTLTKITESLMDPQHASTNALQKTEGFLYFDPRSSNARGTMPPSIRDARNPTSSSTTTPSSAPRGIEASFGQKRQGFSDALVFVVGGGCMEEYGNLQDWAKRTSGAGGAASAVGRKRVTYGSTEIVNAEAFLAELALLGRET
ncbi:Sec1-like protein [Piedraia hortae CBS 480.64]|uniref:Sec1-like protein n=1 Tax=Piedraia hortae CBS 480.64 TaxID=1314780 RepID=A0A6A7C191_9PEZI|nr:Sec1-like protein [Piedraia hortae CBS 480.64]